MKLKQHIASVLLPVISVALNVMCAASPAGNEASDPLERAKRQIAAGGEFDLHLVEDLTRLNTLEARKLLCSLLEYLPKSSTPDEAEYYKDWAARYLKPTVATHLSELGSGCVVPTLRVWLKSGVENPTQRAKSGTLYNAIQCLGLLRDAESLPVIAKFYTSPNCDGLLRGMTADAIATIAAPSSTNFFVQIIWDDTLPESARINAAIALVRQGSDLGREFLLAMYDLSLVRLKAEGRGGLPYEYLKTLGDPKLISMLKERAARESHASVHRAITSLVGYMELNELPIEEVIKIAKNDSWSGGQKRFAAIWRIGREGGPDMIPVLASLSSWKDIDPEYADRHENLLDNLRGAAKAASLQIRQRNWASIQEP